MLRTRYLQFCLKDISLGLLGLRFTDLAEFVTSVPPWVVWLDYTSPVVEGTEPHRSKAVYRRGKKPPWWSIVIAWCRYTDADDVTLLTHQSHWTHLLLDSTPWQWSHQASPSKPLGGSSRMVLWVLSLCHCPVGTALWQPLTPASSHLTAQAHTLAGESMKRCLGGLWGYSASFCSQGNHYSSGRIPPAN